MSGIYDSVDQAAQADNLHKTILSRFRDAYDLEQPDKVCIVVRDALEKAREQKTDLGFFLNEIRHVALEEFASYTGVHNDKAEESAIRTVAELTVHWFSLRYDPDKPQEARNLVNRTVRYLQRLQEQGYGDMAEFYGNVLDFALRRFKEYGGEHSNRAFQSALHVYDEVTRKTSYYSNKRKGKTTRRIKKS